MCTFYYEITKKKKSIKLFTFIINKYRFLAVVEWSERATWRVEFPDCRLDFSSRAASSLERKPVQFDNYGSFSYQKSNLRHPNMWKW